MNNLRKRNENRSLHSLLEEINAKYGLTNGNSYVSREMVRIYNKAFKREIILEVKKEAALRVLYGQHDRNVIFNTIKENNNND